MSILKKAYELSLWDSDGTNRICTLGAHDMTNHDRALEPRLTRKINGECSLTFKMHYAYIDPEDGKPVVNQLASQIKNESIIKLELAASDGVQWFEFVVKQINKDSNNKVCTYTLQDRYATELARNGFDVVLDSSLQNNGGTAREIASRVLANTDWVVDSDFIPWKQEEGEPPLYTGYNYKTLFHTGLNRYVDLYKLGGETCGSYLETEYYVPNLLQNIVTNPDFLDDDGWYGQDVDGNNQGTSADAVPIINGIMSINSGILYSREKGKEWSLLYSDKIMTVSKEDLANYKENSTTVVIDGAIWDWNKAGIRWYCICTGVTDDNKIKFLTTAIKYSDSAMRVKMTSGLYRLANGSIVSAISDLYDGELQDGYFNALRCSNMKFTKTILNSGPYDMRNSIGGFVKDDHYILKVNFYTASEGESGAELQYSDLKLTVALKNMANSSDPDIPDVLFTTNEQKLSPTNGLYTLETIVPINGTISAEKLESSNYRLEFSFSEAEAETELGDTIFITKCECYQAILKNEEKEKPVISDYYSPTDSLSEDTSYKEIRRYFSLKNSSGEIDYSLTKKQIKFIVPNGETPQPETYAVNSEGYIEKRGLVNIKESNYFNAIQNIASVFKVWPRIEITHNRLGVATSKKIHFYYEVGRDKAVGFSYNVNTKSIKRTLDSKAITTKLIVKSNSNEFGTNGFCSIARASENTTKDNVIYNFDYYIKMGILSSEKLNKDLKIASDADLHLINNVAAGTSTKETVSTYVGFYPQLSKINGHLETLASLMSQKTAPLAKLESTYMVNKTAYEAGTDELISLKEKFYQLAGFGYNDIKNDKDRQEKVNNSTTLYGYLRSIAQLEGDLKTYKANYEAAEEDKNKMSEQYEKQLEIYDRLLKLKSDLNKKFYNAYHRYIQEGTWIDESYYDDNLYYQAAYKVSTKSAMPQVTYDLDVLSLSVLPDYEDYDFSVGDRTFAIDPDFFGYENEDGTGNKAPRQEQVTITETMENLDDPTQNTIKVRTNANQFEDLFQSIVATVQTMQYAEGSYNRAAALAEADAAHKISFLTNAINDAEMVLSNSGDQTVVIDKEGITITDALHPNRALRMVSGAILLKGQNEKGESKWMTGITANGISANVLTAGQINTGLIQIMNGDEPTFRWDSHGITAYDFSNEYNDVWLSNLDTSRGVRFDRFGIYGYRGKDGEEWHPINTQEVMENSTFALTREGLLLNLSAGEYGKTVVLNDEQQMEVSSIQSKWHSSKAQLGRVGEFIYNTWHEGLPIYDEESENPDFVKVMAIGDLEGNEQLVIYDDGTLVTNNIKLTGSVEWVPEASPSRSVYGSIALKGTKPPDKWYYKDIPDNDPGEGAVDEEGNLIPLNKRWHKIKGDNDIYYCHTDTAGAVWDGPFLISGRSIVNTLTYFSVWSTEQDPTKIEDKYWTDTFPMEVSSGSYLYTKYVDEYDDGSKSKPRYSVSYFGTNGKEGFVCYIESSMGNLFEQNATGETDLTAKIILEGQEQDPNGENFVYAWYKNNELLPNTGKTIKMKMANIMDTSMYFKATSRSS